MYTDYQKVNNLKSGMVLVRDEFELATHECDSCDAIILALYRTCSKCLDKKNAEWEKKNIIK